jgi:prepilin-type N-terminal cleavage/methylation domain-containing protein
MIPFRAVREQKGFTLVELLVAMAVLAFIVAMAVQILSFTLQVSVSSSHQLDATQRCRAVLDAIGADLTNLMVPNGSTVLVQDTSGTVQLAFLSSSRGPNTAGTDFRLLTVGYQLITTGTNQGINRTTSPVQWGTTDLLAQSVTTTGTTTSILAKSIVRFDAVALLDNGQTVLLTPPTPTPPATTVSWVTTTTTASGQTVPSGWSALVLAQALPDPNNPRVKALIIGVASLDDQTFNLPNVSTMGSQLTPPTVSAGQAQTPVDAWNAAIDAGNLKSFPKPAVTSLRLDQRTYTLP